MSIGPWSTWLQDAACQHHNPLLWDESNPAGHEQARAICRDCPVRSECLEAAGQEPWATGVWGGAEMRPGADPDFTDKTPRATMPEGRTLAPCGTVAAYQRHLYNDEDPCFMCRRANAERSKTTYHATNEEQS